MPETLINISQTKLRMRRGFVVFGEVVYLPGGICGPRVQHDYQLVILHRGEIDLHLDRRRIKIAPGQGILLTPELREHFCFSCDFETHHSWCSIDPDAIPQKLRRLLKSVSAIPAPIDSRIGSLMELGKTTLFEGQDNSVLEVTFHLSLGVALVSGFALGIQARMSAPKPGDQALVRVEQFISNEFGRRLTLSDLAKAAGVSPQYLLKLFRLQRGYTPTRYLYERRLNVAADQLTHTGLSIKEIALYCGFANEFHFSRKFKATYGESPRSWRSRNWSLANT